MLNNAETQKKMSTLPWIIQNNVLWLSEKVTAWIVRNSVVLVSCDLVNVCVTHENSTIPYTALDDACLHGKHGKKRLVVE